MANFSPNPKQYKVEVKGVQKLRKRLDLAGLSALPLRQYMRFVGATIREHAIANAPEDSGALKRSIHMQRIPSKGRLPGGVRVYASSPKAPYVHGDPKKKRLKLSEPYTRSKPHNAPIRALEKWGPVKRGEVNAWVVQRAIAEKGTPLVPFFLIAEHETRTERIAHLKTVTKGIETNWKASRGRI
tara:strand:+ start:9878 stop:10432 length:555 start_codon:yes stop_codon:yes gene_type:complete